MLMFSLMFVLRKPSSLKYTPYLDECAMSLNKNPEHPSDLNLVHELQHFRVAESVTEAFDHSSGNSVQDMGDGKLKILVRALVLQLDNSFSSLPAPPMTNSKCWSFSILLFLVDTASTTRAQLFHLPSVCA